MCVALVGGMNRLQSRYIDEARRHGIKLKVFNEARAAMQAKIGGADAIVLFTNKVSHRAVKEVKSVAKSKNIPVLMSHSCGLYSLRDCLRCLSGSGRDAQRHRRA